jgi:hypothetical protein
MSVLLYGITEAHAPLAGGSGLVDRPLRTVTHDNLRAVVSDLDNGPPTDEDSLWAYEQVVERLMAEATVLPARFGTTARADHEIEAMLAERRAELTETLARVREAVEFAVHAPADPQPAEPTSGQTAEPTSEPTTEDAARTGTAYMQRLLSQDRRIRELDAAAGQLIRATRRITHGTAYLVARDDAEEFVANVMSLGLTATGPWPPYSFTTAS